jgi:hypothetical protein
MARKQANTVDRSEAKSFSHLDDETHYDVVLARPIKVGRAWVRPNEKPNLKGKVIKEFADAIESVTNA